ncbi:unnamed protein product [Knipowitschia caucasica]
MLIVQKPDPC